MGAFQLNTRLLGTFSAVLGFVLAGCAHFEPKTLHPETGAEELESRQFTEPGLREFVSTNLHRPFPAWPPSDWDFDQLTLAAIYFHPELDVARAQWSVARAAIKTSGGRPNPVLSFTPEYNVNAASGISPWAPMVSLDVPIETAGKRGHRIRRSMHLAEAARLQVVSQAWLLRSQLRGELLEHTARQNRAALLEARLEIQEQIVAALQHRLAAGTISANELAGARIASTRWQLELAAARSGLEESRAAVAAAIGVPVKSLAGARFRLDLPTEVALPDDVTELRRAALRQRADLRAALAEYAASQSALQLEIAKQWPDLHLGPGYQWDQGEGKWSLGVSLELPVLNQNQGPIAEAEARRSESAAQFVALQARIIAQLDRVGAVWQAAREQLRQMENLSADQRKQLSRIEAAQVAGGADRLDLASVRLEVATTELLRHDVAAQAARARGELEDALQRPLAFMERAALQSQLRAQASARPESLPQ